VDSNIARVLNRYFGMDLEGEISRNKKIVEKADECLANAIVSQKNFYLLLINNLFKDISLVDELS
jgi:adenine-specific DNA glycosylase